MSAGAIGRRAAALALSGGLALLLCAASYPEPDSRFYVNDFAGVLSAETEARIMARSPALAEETGAQIVVVTVPTLGGQDPQTYALNLARQWGIGGGEQDNGLLLLLAPEERQARVEVGRGLEGALNDAKVGRLLDRYAVEAFRAGDFDGGVRALYDALLSEVLAEYGMDALPGHGDAGGGRFPTPLLLAAGVLAAAAALGLGRGGGRPPRGGGFYGGPFIGGGFPGGPRGGGFGGGGGGFGGGGAGRKFIVPPNACRPPDGHPVHRRMIPAIGSDWKIPH